MRLQPGVAEIAVDLIGHRHLLLDDRGGHGRHQVQHQRGGEGLGYGELQGGRVRRGDQRLDVVLVPAELGEQEGRGLVEQHDPLQREGHVVGSDRCTALELLVRPQLERVGPGVRRHLPALGHAAHQLVDVLGFVPHEPVVNAGGDDLRRDLVGFARIEGDQAIDLARENHAVLRRGRPRRRNERGQRQHRRRCHQGPSFQHMQSPRSLAFIRDATGAPAIRWSQAQGNRPRKGCATAAPPPFCSDRQRDA